MARIVDAADTLKYSLCQKSQRQARKLITGPGVHICNECVDLCNDTITEELAQDESLDFSLDALPKPREIYELLNEYVIGQDTAKRTLTVVVYNHYKRIRTQDGPKRSRDEEVQTGKSNILFLGLTDTGRTYLAQFPVRMLDVPFVIADATALTEAGYVGEDVENIFPKLIQAVDDDVKRAEIGIIYIDEIGKISRKPENPPTTRDASGEGVQQALPKIIEGAVALVPPQGGWKHPQQEYLQLDTSNTLFICAGAFARVEEIISPRAGRRGIGFGSELHVADNGAEVLSEATSEDLHKSGLIPESVGCLPVVAATEELTEGDPIRILTEPKNALVCQYERMLELDEARLQIDGEALHEIPREAIARGMGARGFRSIMESLLKEAMFGVPSRSDTGKIVFDAVVTKDGGEPTLVFKKAKNA